MVSSTQATDDPRLRPECLERIPRETGDITLVGVVHDHPASVYRVQTVIDDVDPAVVALELPPLALPLFRQYTADGTTPPDNGGEMSAAIQAAGSRRVVGIDLPRARSMRPLLSHLYADAASARTALGVLGAVWSLSAHAVRCRLAAAWGRLSETPRTVDDPIDHDCSATDPPAEQVAHEDRIRSLNTSLTRAFERPRTLSLFDEARESAMATSLTSLRRDGDVVAVVGFAHLDAIESGLRD